MPEEVDDENSYLTRRVGVTRRHPTEALDAGTNFKIRITGNR